MKSTWLKLLYIGASFAAASMTACDRQDARTEKTSMVAGFIGPDPHEQEAPLSKMKLAHLRSSDALQAVGSSIQFEASNAALSTDLSSYTIYLNDSIVDESKLLVQGDRLTITSALKDGRNEVLVFSPDAKGSPVEVGFSIWAGSASVEGKVVDDAGKPVSGATVVGEVAEDSTASATTSTDSAGKYVLNNFPNGTIEVTATDTGGKHSVSISGQAGTAFSDIVFANSAP